MPRPCSICQHPELAEINAALIDGVSLRVLAEHYGVKRSSLSRHQGAHPLTLGYVPPDELTRSEFARHLWQFSVKQGEQRLYCPLCKPERPSASIRFSRVWCDRCGLHTFEHVAKRMGFTLVPYHGFTARQDEIVRRYTAMVEEGKPFRMPRRTGTA